MSIEELRVHLRDALSAIRTERVDFEAIHTIDDDVWIRATVHALSLATHTPLDIAWIAQYRFDGDKIAEAWTLHQTNMDWSP